MRVLFTTIPVAGAFHPLVPVAQALDAAGHVVAFATSRSYCPTIETTGFRSFPVGMDWDSTVAFPTVARAQELFVSGDRPFSSMRDFFGDFLVRPMVSDLLDLAHTWHPDVIVRDPLEFGGCIAAESLKLPHVACGPLFCLWDGARHCMRDETERPEFDAIRKGYGLPADPNLTMLYRHLHLAFLPPSFMGPDLFVPPTVRFLRPVSFNQSGEEGLPDWIATLPKQPTVHASLGTVQHRTPGIFPAIIEALRDEDMNVILAVGRDQDPADFGVQPPNIHIERYIPHTLLLPHCDAVVTHGGFSSIIACLTEGLPMVLLPISGDQPGNAERCQALGVGRVIAPNDRTPAAIRSAVREVLDNPSYRKNAAALRDEMNALPDVEQAVSLLEKLVAGHSAAGAASI